MQAVVQTLRGQRGLAVDGVLHALARHGLADPDQTTRFRSFLQCLNDAQLVAYSKRQQTVRLVLSDEVDAMPLPTVMVVNPETPFSNVLHLRRVLRECKGHVWWADPHFPRKGLEPLAEEVVAGQVTEVRILSGPAQADDLARKDFKRFKAELAPRGVAAEWRVVETKHRDWHDRYIVTDGKAWNVPPVNTLFKNDYSELWATSPPPFEVWWQKGAVFA